MADRLPDSTLEADYDSAAEAWLSLEVIGFGMDFGRRAAQIAVEFHKRLADELARVSAEPTRQEQYEQLTREGVPEGEAFKRAFHPGSAEPTEDTLAEALAGCLACVAEEHDTDGYGHSDECYWCARILEWEAVLAASRGVSAENKETT